MTHLILKIRYNQANRNRSLTVLSEIVEQANADLSTVEQMKSRISYRPVVLSAAAYSTIRDRNNSADEHKKEVFDYD